MPRSTYGRHPHFETFAQRQTRRVAEENVKLDAEYAAKRNAQRQEARA